MAGEEEDWPWLVEALPIGDVWDSSDLLMFLQDQLWFYKKQQQFLEAMIRYHEIMIMHLHNMNGAAAAQVGNLESFIEGINHAVQVVNEDSEGKGKGGKGKNKGCVKGGEGKGKGGEGKNKDCVKGGEAKGSRSRSPAPVRALLHPTRLPDPPRGPA